MPNGGDVTLEETDTLLDEMTLFYQSHADYCEDTATLQKSLIPSLLAGQYHIIRDDQGQIVAACHYWKLDDERLELVKRQIQPDNVYTGDILYSVEGATKQAGLSKKLWQAAKEQNPHYRAFAHHRRGKFSMHQRGVNHGI